MAVIDIRHLTRQLQEALAVLALLVLSLSQALPAQAVSSLAAPSCEVHRAHHDGPCLVSDTGTHHGHATPCHACRATAAVLPPPPALSEPAFGELFVADRDPVAVPLPNQWRRTAHSPRAPPVVA